MNTQNHLIVLKQFVQKIVIPDDEALDKFCACFHERKLKSGDLFVEAGDMSTQIAFVNSGLLRFFYRHVSGKEFNKSFATENHFIAAYSAYLAGSPVRFTIEALEDCHLLVARLSQISELAEEYPCWEKFRRLLTEQLYVRKEQREAEFLLDDAEHRYHLFQQRYPNIEKRVPQYHIASYLGITPVALSRIRTKNR